jgi:hypothetical protein
MKRLVFSCLSILALALVSAPPCLSSTTTYWSNFKFELTTAVSFQKSLLDTSYEHVYSPPFLSGAYQSEANQTINVRGKEGWGFNLGFAYFPAAKLGLQFLVEYAKPKVTGANSPYAVDLNYALTYDAQPPYPYDFVYSYGWPRTAGHLTEICLSLNGVFRLPLTQKIALSFSGGLTYFHVDGEGTGLAYSRYWWESPWFLGDTFNYKFKLGPINSLGLNMGGEFSLVLFSNMCIVMDARYFGAPSKTLGMAIIDEGLAPDPFDQIRTTMNLQDISINPSFYRVNLGLKYLF